MIAACRKCGTLLEMTEEEAMTPIWCCQGSDRLCMDCFHKDVYAPESIYEKQEPHP